MRKKIKIYCVFAGLLFMTGCGSLETPARDGARAAEVDASTAKRNTEFGALSIEAMTWAEKVKPGISVAEVELTLASVAAEHNIKPVGEFLVSPGASGSAAKSERFIKIYSYCSPSVAKQFIHASPHMAAFMPCRIALVENDDGLWLYTMNLDMLLQSEHRLSDELMSNAGKIRSAMRTLLERAAEGEF